MPRLTPWALAGACGALTALCLPRAGLCPLAWISLAPLVALWSRESPRRAMGLGCVAGFCFHGLALCWIYATCRFAEINVLVALLAWAALSLVLALHWGLVGAAGAWAAAPLPAPWRPWAWAALWTALSFAWERWTPRLSGDLLAYTQYRNLALVQVGSLLGPHALGFLIAAFNAALVPAWREAQGGPREEGTAANMVLATALALLAWVYGVVELTRRPTAGPQARVEILQPVIDQYQKWDAGSQDRVLAVFDGLLSLPRADKPHLIVWPETAVPWLMERGQEVPVASAWSRRLSAFQLVGLMLDDAGGRYNAAVLVGPDGRGRQDYRKRQLVPFGEFVPLPFLRRWIGKLNELGGLESGKNDQPLLETPLGPAAASICYEAMFPRWAKLDAGRGARLLINITNDGWYKDTWGPHQHFKANVFRALETRTTVIRSGNTGVSAVIDPWGVETARLELNQRGRLDASVPLEDPFPRRSFYVRHGDWLGWGCLGAAALLAALAGRGRRAT